MKRPKLVVTLIIVLTLLASTTSVFAGQEDNPLTRLQLGLQNTIAEISGLKNNVATLQQEVEILKKQAGDPEIVTVSIATRSYGSLQPTNQNFPIQPNLKLTVSGLTNGLQYSVVTDANGDATLNLPVGFYSVEIEQTSLGQRVNPTPRNKINVFVDSSNRSIVIVISGFSDSYPDQIWYLLTTDLPRFSDADPLMLQYLKTK